MKHGTNNCYVNRGCRCEPCTRAQRLRVNLYRSKTGAGSRRGPVDPIFVPIEPARAHVRQLRDSGYLLTWIAADIGASLATLSWAMSKGRRIDRHRAARILALRPLEAVAVDEVVVDRLLVGADYKTIRATREERLAAYAARPSDAMARHLGLNATRERAA